MAKRKPKSQYVKQVTYKKYMMAQSVLSNSQYMSIKDEFLSKFFLCEIACKSVLEYYKKIQENQFDEKDIKLTMKSIPAAFNKFGYEIDNHILGSIFGGSKKRGQKSAKKLRDCIVHSLSEEDIKEVIERKDSLYSSMNAFLLFIERAGNNTTTSQ